MKKAHLPLLAPRLALLLVLLVALVTIPLATSAEVGNIPESFPTTRWEDQEGIAGKAFEERSAADKLTSYEYYDHDSNRRETVTIDEAEYLGSRENPIAIDTVEDLILFGQRNIEYYDQSYYILTAEEYDLDGHTMLPMTPSARDASDMSDASRFYGTLIGNGAVIKNAWIIGSDDTTAGVDAHVQPALFTAVGGRIVDLTLENIRVAGGVGRMGILYADTTGEYSTPGVANVTILGGELYPDGDITSITTLPDTAVNSTAEVTLCTSFTPKENMGLCHTALTVAQGCTLTVEEGRQVLISPTVTGNVIGSTHTHNENGKSYRFLSDYGIHEEAVACENCPIGYVGEYREANCDFKDNGICPCGEYQEPPMLESVYYISNAGQLLWYAQNALDNAILTADIVVNETVLDENGRFIGNPDDLIEWTPFRLEEDQYLDGNGHTVSGLYADSYSAAFISGMREGATLKNLRIENSYFDGTQVGGLVCSAAGGRIENCSFSGLLAASRSDGCVGGLVGTVKQSENGTALVNCLGAATFEVENATQGALIGCVDDTAPFTVTNCYYLTVGALPGVGGTDAEGNVGTPVTAAQLASGEITWKLNGESDEGIWKQTLHGTGAQPYPHFEGMTVYARRDGIHLCNTAFTDATATVYTNDDREAGEGRLAHLAEEDDRDCTTAVLCRYCSFVVTNAAQAHVYDALCTDTGCNSQGCEATRPVVHTIDAAVWCYDESSHWHACPCGEVVANDKVAHEYGSFTWQNETQHKKVCECGATVTAEHTWNDGELTKAPTCREPGEITHTCSGCEATSVRETAIDAAAHLDDNGDRHCDLCSEPMGGGLTGDGLTGDGLTGGGLSGGGLSGGAIAGIAVGATAVVGLGGFSLFWFVLKKKSWHDLIALFKK